MTTPVGLASEDAAVYGYGLLLATADPGIRGAVRRELAAHRARRDAAEELWPDSPPAPVGYLAGPDTSTSPVLLAIRLESDCCEAWRSELGISEDPDRRRFCVDALTAAAIQLARWRTLVPGAPFEALPGFPPSD
ncbi:MAG TPA: ferritin-like domain-containing protein [Candidatus Dietzia intestinigallinarum]|nr:ferritin-like domain-containing protein [Candidatus Dietzia intestinigallinarum]